MSWPLRIAALSKGVGWRYQTGDVVVSSVAANGVPVGNDTTGDGTPQKPYLTIDKGFSMSVAGKTLWLNGVPSNPTDYRAATFLNINKGVFVEAIAPLGAKITSTTTSTRAVHFTALATGVTAGLGRVIVDARGLCPSAVTINHTATRPVITLRGTKLIDWTTNGIAQSSASAQTFDLVIRSVVAESAAAAGGVLFSALGASSVDINGISIDIASATGSGISLASSGGALVSAAIRNAQVDLHLDPTLTGSTRHLGIGVQDMPNAIFEDCEVNIYNAPGSNDAALFRVIASLGANMRDSSGAIVRRCVGYNGSNGGLGVQIGQDGVSVAAGLVMGAVVEDCSITGSAAAAAGGFHGYLNGDRNNTVFRRNTTDYVGIGMVDKDGLGCVMFDNIIKRCTQSGVRPKGAVNGKYRHNSIIQSSGFTGEAVLADSDVDTLSGCDFTGNLVVTAGGKSVSVTGTGLAMAYNVYWPVTAFGATDFLYNGVTYATFAGYKAAVEATAETVDPILSGVVPTNAAIRIVPADALVPTDFIGAAFASPAAAGAYEVAT